MPLTITSFLLVGFLDYFAYGLSNSSLGKRGSTRQGLNNLGYTDDNPKNHQLIIPKIEIQPATPLSSEPNTPATKPKAQTTPAPVSPLVINKTQGNQPPTDDPKRKKSELDDNTVLNAAAVVASLMSKKDIERDSVETEGEDKGKDMEGKEDSDEERKDDDKMVRGSDSDESVESNDDLVIQSEDVVSGVLPAIIATSLSLSSNTPSEASQTEEDTEVEKYTKTDQVDTSGEDVKGDDVKVEDLEEEDDKNTEENTNTKTKLNKPPPLILPSITRLNDDQEGSGIPHAYYSSPELSPPHSPPPSPPHSPPYPPPSSPISPPPPARPHPVLVRSQSEANLIRSVPTTPAGRRHPIKVLRRMSSFDDIPPSSPDSPFAKRVASFVVIPVHEPGLDSTDNSLTPSSLSPSPSPSASPIISEDNLFQAVDKLNKYKKDEDKKIFTVGSSESLDNIVGETGETSEFLSPRRMVSREPDMLDPIRERGESKLYVTEVHPSQEEANKVTVMDTNSIEK